MAKTKDPARSRVPRTAMSGFRLKPEELTLLRRAAGHRSIQLASYVRSAAIEAARRDLRDAGTAS